MVCDDWPSCCEIIFIFSDPEFAQLLFRLESCSRFTYSINPIRSRFSFASLFVQCDNIFFFFIENQYSWFCARAAEDFFFPSRTFLFDAQAAQAVYANSDIIFENLLAAALL